MHLTMRWKPEQQKGGSLRESANPAIGKMNNIDDERFALRIMNNIDNERFALSSGCNPRLPWAGSLSLNR